eukprot:SAG31_NODE_966_length_10688_cov_8.343564_8_plen_250_part_00
MSSAEAVQIVSELLADHGPDANIADLFIEKVMEKVLKRMQATYKAERMTTMEELKSRPPGKKAFKKGPPTKWCKSCLHDDITVVILDFTSVAGGSAKSDIATTLFRDKAPASILAAREAFNALDASETGTVTAADVVAASAKMGRSVRFAHLNFARFASLQSLVMLMSTGSWTKTPQKRLSEKLTRMAQESCFRTNLQHGLKSTLRQRPPTGAGAMLSRHWMLLECLIRMMQRRSRRLNSAVLTQMVTS